MISAAQFGAIAPVLTRRRISLYLELNALFYLGVLSTVAGIGWVIQRYAAALGDLAILSSLTIVLAGSFYHCVSRGRPYSRLQVESPTLAFDYVLYLGCLVFGIELAYLESHFHLLPTHWDLYLLVSAGLFFSAAYRWDNRFVLSLALSTLAAWFGLKLSPFTSISAETLRRAAFLYSMLVIAAGIVLDRVAIKKHFTETYLHVAANVLFIASVSGVIAYKQSPFYVMALLLVAAAAVYGGVRFRRFAFIVYAVIYAYIGISAEFLRRIDRDTAVLAYFVISGALIIASMVVLARHFGREA